MVFSRRVWGYALVVLGEAFAWYHWLGGLLTLVGIYFATATGPRVAHHA